MKKPFKPVHMFSDENKIRRKHEEIAKELEKANQKVKEAEDLLYPVMQRSLTNEEKFEVLIKGSESFIRLADVKGMFGNALLSQLNLKDIYPLLGLEPVAVTKFNNSFNKTFFQHRRGFILIEDKFVASDEYKEEIKNKYHYYTQDEEQNKKLEYANRLSKVINEGLESGNLKIDFSNDIFKRTLSQKESDRGSVKRVGPNWDSIYYNRI